MKNIRQLSLLFLLLALVLMLGGCMSSYTFETIKASDLQHMLNSSEKFTLVDIREADTYQRGHIAGAVNLPFSSFEVKYQQLKPDDKIVLVCYSGSTSQQAAQFLLEKGYKKVSSVAGGMEAWQGPVTK